MRLLTLLLLILFSLPCFSQNNELLRSRGLLPKNIIGTVAQIKQYELAQKRLDGEAINETQVNMAKDGAELCNEIIMSGRLMVNDSLSSYANKVLDGLLKNEPLVRKKLHVYFYYSTGTNAITLYNGMIIIELGLMAYIKNEAQLAFILAHEVSHFREDHFVKYYSFRNDRSRKKSNDPLAEILTYSRELELQADSLGYELYKGSGYSLNEAQEVMSLLGYSDIPEDQVPFYPSFFEHGNYIFPVGYTLHVLMNVGDSVYDETNSTHPSYTKRSENIKQYIGNSNSGSTLFIVSKAAFNMLRSIAREECCSIYLESLDYGNAIYNAYTLLKEDSLYVFAKGIIGKALYELTAYKNLDPPFIIPEIFIISEDRWGNFDFESSVKSNVLIPYYNVAGERQRLHFFLNKLNGPEMVVLALDWNWKLFQAGNYKDSTQSRICNNLFEILADSYNILEEDFDWQRTAALREKQKALLHDTIPKLSFGKNTNRLDTSRYSRPYANQNTQWATDNKKFDIPVLNNPAYEIRPDYIFTAFDYHLKDLSFKKRLQKPKQHDWTINEHPDLIIESSDAQRENSNGLGIKNICVVPPDYYKIKLSKDGSYTYDVKSSASFQVMQQRQIKAAAKNAKAVVLFLSPEEMDSTSVNNYNTYCLATEWLNERLMHLSNGYAFNLASNGATLSKMMGTRYLMFSSIIGETNNSSGPNRPCKMESYVFDVITGDLVLYYADIYNSNNSEAGMLKYYSRVFKKITAER